MIAALKRIPLGILVVALVAVPHLISILLRWHDVPLTPGQIIGSPDPDPWLRLSVVRDWLSGGSWYSHTITHSNAPWTGIATPWTRPLDVLIALLVQLQPESVDLTTRLLHAAMLVPWLCMTLLLAGMVRAIRAICPIPSALFMGVALVAAIPLIWNYFGLAYADHHALLATLFIWAIGGIIHPTPSPRSMVCTGAILGLMLWISPESLALIGVLYAWFGLDWLRGNATSMRLLATLATSTAAMSAIAVMLERPPAAWGVAIYDSISIVYVVILALVAALAWILRLLRPPTITGRLVVSALGTIGVALAVVTLYPLALKGPMAEVHPFILSTFLPNITEAQPLFHKNWVLVLSLLVHPVIALAILAASLGRRDCFYSRETALKLGFLYVGVMALFLGQVRWSYYCYPVIALIIAPWLGALFTPEHTSARGRWPAKLLEHLAPNQQTMRRLPIITLVFALHLLIAFAVPDEATPASKRFDACSQHVRKLVYGGKLTELLGGKSRILFTHTNFGGEILFWTPHRIIASNYHREGRGIQYLWEADAITDATLLRGYLAQRQVEALLLCPSDAPTKDGILNRLQQGEIPPAWLTHIPYVPYPKTVKEQAMEKGVPPITGADPALFLVIPQTRAAR